jgi:hypothetical protein
MSMWFMHPGGSAGGVVQGVDLSLISSDDDGFTVEATYHLDADGVAAKTTETPAGSGRSNVLAWWGNAPEASIGASYYVKLTHSTGTSRYTSGLSGGLGAYHDMDPDLDILFQMAAGVGTDGVPEVSTYTVQFSSDGIADDLVSYTLTVSLTELGP